MKRKITKILAALALLVFTMPSLVAWGQTRDNVTLTKTMNEVVSENGYTVSSGTDIGDIVTEIELNDAITMSTSGDPNCGTFWGTTTIDWRLYQNKAGDVTITVSDGTLVSVKFTYNKSNNGTLLNGSTQVASGTTVSATGTSITLTVGNTGTATNGQVRITAVEVVYTPNGSSSVVATTVTIDDSNLTNTNLYNGTAAGSLSATVSANGEPIEGATVTWASSNTGVATIASDGTVTLAAVGSTNITASYAGVEGEYGASSATYQLNVTNSDPNAPGTANNPYTVAQALAANPATGVYVHGIISTITEVSTQHGNATYKISDDGTTSGEMIVYRGKYLENVAFTSTDQIQLGDEVVVTGELKLYSGANQLTTGNYIVSLVRPTPTVAAPVFTPAAGTFTGTQNVTITCETEGSSIYYTTNGDAPTNESTLYEGAITVSETTTIKAIAYVGTDASSVVTATYTIEQPLTTIQAILDVATGTATPHYITFGNWVVTGKNSNGHQAFATDGVNGFVLYNGDDMGFVAGDVLSGTVQCNVQLFGESAEITGLTSTTEGLTVTQNGTVTAVETTIDQLAPINTGSVITLNNVTYNGSALSDGTNTIYPYNTMYEGTFVNGTSYNVTGVFFYNSGNKRIMPRSAEDIVEVEVTEPNTITAGTLTHVSINELWDGDTFEDITLGDEVEEGTMVYFSLTIDENYTLESVSVLDASENEVQLTENTGSWSFTMPNSSVTINATATQGSVPPVTGDKYVKVTSTSDLADGQYLIVYDDGNVAFNGGLRTLDAENNTVSVTISENEIAVTNATTAAEFTIDMTNGTLKSASGYYIGVSSNNNGLKQTEDATTYINSFSIDADGNAVIAAVFDGSTMTMRYNSASNQNRFRYYKSGQQAIQLYKKVETTPAGYTYTVNGYGTSAGGYVLMATPTTTNANPATVGMITDDLGASATTENSTYDLYYYDQIQDLEWRNYRAQSFELEPGKGYLYASKDGVTLTFTGDLNPAFADVALPYTQGNAIKSLYLAGNSSTEAQTFYVYDNDLALQTVNFLTMNSNGDGFTTTTATSLTAEPMQGFFVQAAGSNWTLSTAELSNGNNSDQGVSLININVMRDRGNVIDNAIVSFSEGSMMNKFYLRDNTTRVYIPQGNEEMAVVRSAAEAEMPVSFKASENGTYTLAVETENVEMNYLHLIDNLTGMDVDLLQTPSYTFEAKTNDYTSRFRLVFKASSTSSEADGTFAYFNGSNWTVSNLGEATLQVVDVTGRTVSSETINGNATISLNQTPGVYMLRLVNGNSVKVQKVVVR